MAGENIDNLIMEQYLTLTQGNQAQCVVRPEIWGNVNFKIKSQFMRELREDTFSRNKNDDAHEHIERVLDITMADHSQKWHDGSPSQSVCSSNNSDRMAAILYDGPHLDKECPLNEDAKSDKEEDDDLSSEGFLCQLSSKEINPGSFTLPCTIGNLKETNMLVEMVDMTKTVPLGIVENILVKIDKFLFSLDFVIIDMLETRNETMILEKYGEEKIDAILDTVLDKLDDSWFSETTEDEDYLDGITDYLEPMSYDGFINN
ncbi:hypothetical protein Tco_0633222 [Tanacetum coccineum]